MAVYEFPTSFGQRRMWLLAEMDPGEPTYNITWALWLDGPLDVTALQQAWDAALVRHEALRTTFRNESGVPVQVIEDEPAGRAAAGHLGRATDVRASGSRPRLALIRRPGPDPVRPGHRAARPRRPGAAVGASARARGGDAPHRRRRLVVPDPVRRAVSGLRGDQLAAPTRSPRNRRSSTPTSRSGRSSTTRTAGTPRTIDSGGLSWPTRRSALSLPTDEPYPARQTFAAGSIDSALDGQLGRRAQGGSRPGTRRRCSPSCWPRTRSCSPG